MSWEWSHSNEAYSFAEDKVRALPRAELLTILREWAYKVSGGVAYPHEV